MRPYCPGCFGGLTEASLSVSMRAALRHMTLTGALKIQCAGCQRVVTLLPSPLQPPVSAPAREAEA
jgi:hypothetical protein